MYKSENILHALLRSRAVIFVGFTVLYLLYFAVLPISRRLDLSPAALELVLIVSLAWICYIVVSIVRYGVMYEVSDSEFVVKYTLFKRLYLGAAGYEWSEVSIESTTNAGTWLHLGDRRNFISSTTPNYVDLLTAVRQET